MRRTMGKDVPFSVITIMRRSHCNEINRLGKLVRRTIEHPCLAALLLRHTVAYAIAAALMLVAIAARAQPFPQYIDQSNPATTPLTATDMLPVVQGPPGSGRATNKLAGNLLPTFLPADYSGNVAVNNANFCGQSVNLTGNAQATVTVSAASGFPSGCQIRFNNIDGAPAAYPATGGHGRIFSGITLPTGYPNENILYPGQGGTILNDNGNWVLVGFPSRLKTGISQPLVIYVDPSLGSDSNDGFSVTTAMKNPQQCYYRVLADIDGNSNDPVVTCQIISNSVDNLSGCMHLSGDAFVGAQGGAQFIFDGFDPVNSVNRTLSCTGNAPLQTFLYTNVQVRRINLTSDTACIIEGYNSFVNTLDGVVLNGCGSGAGAAAIVISDQAQLLISNSFTVNGPYKFFISSAGGRVTTSTITVTGGTLTGTTFVNATSNGFVDLSKVTFSGFTFTGQHGGAQNGGRILTATEACDTDLPGSSSSTVSNGGFCGLLGGGVQSIVKLATYDLTTATGNQSLTGFGFTPSTCHFAGAVSGATLGNYTTVSGDSDSATNQAVTYLNGTTNVGYNNAAVMAASDGTNIQVAALTSYDANGITLHWTKTNSPTGTFSYSAHCFR